MSARNRDALLVERSKMVPLLGAIGGQISIQAFPLARGQQMAVEHKKLVPYRSPKDFTRETPLQ